MMPREEKVMSLLSNGAPACAKDLRRDSGLSLNALHRVLMRLIRSGDVAEVPSGGEVRYISCWVSHRPKQPDLHTIWMN